MIAVSRCIKVVKGFIGKRIKGGQALYGAQTEMGPGEVLRETLFLPNLSGKGDGLESEDLLRLTSAALFVY